MKKIAVFIACAILLCGCQSTASKQNSELSMELYEAYLEEFEYPIKDPMIFSADEQGEIVCIDSDFDTVRRYSSEGVLTAEFPIPEGISIKGLACNERIFFLGAGVEKKIILGELTSEGVNELYSIESDTMNNRLSLVLSGDKIYFSAVGAEPKYIDYPNGLYRHNGLVAYSYDLESGKCEEICEIVSFAKSEKGAMFYCCDSDGFYFVDYDGSFGERHYSKLRDLYAFCPIGENVIVYPGEDRSVKATLLSGEVSSDLIEANAFGTCPFALSSGTLIYNSADLLGEHSVIRRINPQNYIKNLKPINIIMAVDYGDVAAANGYTINKQVISEEELALKLLAKDTDWDAAVIYSRQTFVAQISLNGFFQPLDEQEYLDACQICVKDICETENGKMWALPLGVHINCIVYNKEKCDEYGIDFSEITTEDFLEKTRQLCEDETLRGTWVDVNWQYLNETLLNDCIYNCAPDGEQFRNIMEALNKNANILTEAEYMQGRVEKILEDGSIIVALNNSLDGRPDDFLYQTTAGYSEAMYRLRLNPDFSVAKIPFEGANTGYCMLLVVNPYAPNLEETLELVSDLAKERLTEMSEYSDVDSEGKRQLDEVYDNSEIIMGIPDEIYREDFWAYLADQMTLDEFASEVKRKMAIFLNE